MPSLPLPPSALAAHLKVSPSAAVSGQITVTAAIPSEDFTDIRSVPSPQSYTLSPSLLILGSLNLVLDTQSSISSTRAASSSPASCPPSSLLEPCVVSVSWLWPGPVPRQSRHWLDISSWGGSLRSYAAGRLVTVDSCSILKTTELSRK